MCVGSLKHHLAVLCILIVLYLDMVLVMCLLSEVNLTSILEIYCKSVFISFVNNIKLLFLCLGTHCHLAHRTAEDVTTLRINSLIDLNIPT